jgi:exodeoxyribonuclease VII large subunit
VRRYTVPALHDELDALLRGRYPTLLVEGEISQRTTPSSGHTYLTLRDRTPRGDQVQLTGIVWKDDWAKMSFKPSEGDRVLCRGRLGLYRGAVQLQIHDIAPVGEGALAREIEARKQRLAAAGYLDPRRKRVLAKFPRFIGVATSLTGAALQDFLKVSRERFPAARVLVAPCIVQGMEAPSSVIRAIDLLIEDGRSEVIVVTRGGGGREDLVAFHDEALARAIGDSPIPVVSAVGHQIDTTIADLVADVVAPTPSAAAMAVLPDRLAYAQQVDQGVYGLETAVQRYLRAANARVVAERARLRHPSERLALIRLRLAEALTRLTPAMERRLSDRTARLGAATADDRLARLVRRSLLVRRDQLRVADRLTPAVEREIARRRAALKALEDRLIALSPEAVLGRGYAIVRGPRGVVTDPGGVQHGDRLEIHVGGGSFAARVEQPSRTARQLSLLDR